MTSKTKDFLNTIGINETYMEYFQDSTIEKVIINKNTNRFHFIFNISKLLPIKVYNDLLSSLQEAFHHDITLEIKYQILDDTISEYINEIINEYSNKEIRYGVFKNREIKLIDNRIEYPIYNKIEELNINSIKKEIESKLKKYSINIQFMLYFFIN